MITINRLRSAVLAVAAATAMSMAVPTLASAHPFGGGHFGGGHFGWGGHIGGWGGRWGGMRLGYVGYPAFGDYGCPYGYFRYDGLCYPRPAYTGW